MLFLCELSHPCCSSLPQAAFSGFLTLSTNVRSLIRSIFLRLVHPARNGNTGAVTQGVLFWPRFSPVAGVGARLAWVLTAPAAGLIQAEKKGESHKNKAPLPCSSPPSSTRNPKGGLKRHSTSDIDLRAESF